MDPYVLKKCFNLYISNTTIAEKRGNREEIGIRDPILHEQNSMD